MMDIRIKSYICAVLFAAFLPAGTAFSANAKFEPVDVKAGLRPFYGLVFGEFSGRYYNAPGGLVYARGLYRLNIFDKLMLCPEFSWGVLYLGNKTEKTRKLFLFPFALNIYFDAPALNFSTRAGIFSLRPYIGLGAYLNYYKSPRASAAGCDFGYQAGINLEYRHEKMKNFHVEVSVDHLFTTNFKQYLPLLGFSIGAGYAIEFRGTDGSGAKAGEKTGREDGASLRGKYIEDLTGDDEGKLTAAGDWLGRHEERIVVPRLIVLLLNDRRARVRISAAVALGFIGDRAALDPLAQSVVRDTSDDVKYTSLLSISRLRPDKKTMEAIKQFREGTADPYIRDYIDKMVLLFD